MMDKFDEYIRQQLSKEEGELPESVRKKIDLALSELPESPGHAETTEHQENIVCPEHIEADNDKVISLEEIRAVERREAGTTKRTVERREAGKAKKTAGRKRGSRYRSFVSVAAGLAFTFLFLFPNVSESYAQAIEKIPVIGSIVKVITIRNYFYSDETHELEVAVPRVENEENAAFSEINNDAEALTKQLVDQFYEEMDRLGRTAHGALYVDYEVITNTDRWFTLRLCVSEVKGSSDTYYVFYNMDKLSGEIVRLGDMVQDESFYTVVEEDIKRQMAERMKADENQFYWIEGDSFGEGFVRLTPEHNFYWDADGNLVIPFDKYEVSPGYMGTPEFTVDRKLIESMLKQDCTNK